MKTARWVLVGTFSLVTTFVLMLPPHAWCAGKTPAPGKAKGKSMPSEHIRHMIDATLPMISSLGNAKPPANRAALTEAQAEWTALAQTAPPAQQPMYTAAANAVQMLLAAEDEHSTAVANNKYSKSVHGKQDHQDARISNGGQLPGTARANNAKQNEENAQFRKEELRKEQFMNTGSGAEWTARVEQIRVAVEQAYTAELVAEKQMMAARPATPAPVAPPPSKPPQPSAAQQYSPVGTWTAPKGQWSINDDGSLTTGTGARGTWHWSDPGKREIVLSLPAGDGKGQFGADGKSIEVTMPKGANVHLSR